MPLPELTEEEIAWYILKGYEIKEYNNAVRLWYLNGKYHREDGPAVEWEDGTKEWYLNGQRHREDGHALEYTNGYRFWFLNGKEMSEAQHRIVVSEMMKNARVNQNDVR